MDDNSDLVQRLKKRAEIRRSIPRAEPDRIASLLEEAANRIEELEGIQEQCAVYIESGAGMADLIEQELLDEQARLLRHIKA